MKDLDKLEELFMISRSSSAQFGQMLSDAGFTGDVKLEAWQICNKLIEMDREIEQSIERLRKINK